MKSRPLVRVNRSYGWDKYELRYGREGEKGELLVAQPMLMSEQPRALQVLPALILEFDECQMLMDELYACGIRPTEGGGSIGQLGATQDHLADMRKIAFKVMGV